MHTELLAKRQFTGYNDSREIQGDNNRDRKEDSRWIYLNYEKRSIELMSSW